ncbi:hypothetical protein BDA96_04G068100 [Sorghum bicolor]|uniref:Uncharacterized protein n=1 Tax=Sorghum bicolor TaxID=4558 RepID=A0A921R1I3_SORBI|nr:hypothetical protein BDA96_04G068100 [Sorghum bicolor]KAG0531977.1 hypothetical protein BDA96_04G068100 [Sorghum bicolor]KAG0531978.1 hypothetical protein BDA96_04G068100 [Sorghum bicolor]
MISSYTNNRPASPLRPSSRPSRPATTTATAPFPAAAPSIAAPCANRRTAARPLASGCTPGARVSQFSARAALGGRPSRCRRADPYTCNRDITHSPPDAREALRLRASPSHPHATTPPNALSHLFHRPSPPAASYHLLSIPSPTSTPSQRIQ